MAVAVVAARLRSLLKDAAAASRKGDEIEELDQLVRVVGLLDKFPLPPSSPQADMIAAAVQQRATLQERQVRGLLKSKQEEKDFAARHASKEAHGQPKLSFGLSQCIRGGRCRALPLHCFSLLLCCHLELSGPHAANAQVFAAVLFGSDRRYRQGRKGCSDMTLKFPSGLVAHSCCH